MPRKLSFRRKWKPITPVYAPTAWMLDTWLNADYLHPTFTDQHTCFNIFMIGHSVSQMKQISILLHADHIAGTDADTHAPQQ